MWHLVTFSITVTFSDVSWSIKHFRLELDLKIFHQKILWYKNCVLILKKMSQDNLPYPFSSNTAPPLATRGVTYYLNAPFLTYEKKINVIFCLNTNVHWHVTLWLPTSLCDIWWHSPQECHVLFEWPLIEEKSKSQKSRTISSWFSAYKGKLYTIRANNVNSLFQID